MRRPFWIPNFDPYWNEPRLLEFATILRGITRRVILSLRCLGKWRTPYHDARVTRVGIAGEAIPGHVYLEKVQDTDGKRFLCSSNCWRWTSRVGNLL
jgi:hypothetical protein